MRQPITAYCEELLDPFEGGDIHDFMEVAYRVPLMVVMDLLGVPALRRGVPDLTTRDCFVCGPPAFLDALRRRLVILGVPRRQIHYERFEL